jgi:hypothetical protein
MAKASRPPVYVDTLDRNLKTSETPQWKDAGTKKTVPSIGKLGARVTETGACSVEKFLDAYRNAGCVPKNRVRPRLICRVRGEVVSGRPHIYEIAVTQELTI